MALPEEPMSTSCRQTYFLVSTDAHLDYLSHSTVGLLATMRAELDNALRASQSQADSAAKARCKQTPGQSL